MSSSSTATIVLFQWVAAKCFRLVSVYLSVCCPALPQQQKEGNTQWSNVQLLHSNRKRTTLNTQWSRLMFSGQMSSSSITTETGQYSVVKCPASPQQQKEDNTQHSMVKINVQWSNVQLVHNNRNRTIFSGQMSSFSTATERGQHSTLNGQD